MTKKEMKQLRRIITSVASKRKAVGLKFKESYLGLDFCSDFLEVWCTNTAYKHELNALMMAIDGFGFCTCYQMIDEENRIVWKCF